MTNQSNRLIGTPAQEIACFMVGVMILAWALGTLPPTRNCVATTAAKSFIATKQRARVD